MRQESPKWKVLPKLALAQGVSTPSTPFFFKLISICIVFVVILGACSTLSDVLPPSLDNFRINSDAENDETSLIVIVGANGGLLINSDDVFYKQEFPPRYDFYWDYNVKTKLLAYSGSEYHTLPDGIWSVSDFWAYDYQSNVVTRWWSYGVGRVLWDPSTNFTNARAALIVFDADHNDFSLGIATSPGRVRMLADHVGHAFSWSPDGTEIAFVRQSIDPGIYVLNVKQKYVRQVSDFSYKSIMSVMDQPLWIVDHDILAVADSGDRPLLFVSLNDTNEFVPTTTDGNTIPGPRPTKMLWSTNGNQLIVSGESGIIVETWIHNFDGNMYEVHKSVNLGHAYLAGWYEYGESIILVRPDGVEIYSLSKS